MRKVAPLFAFVLATGLSPANAQVAFEWAKNVGGTNVDGSHSMAIDAAGNVYTTGYFTGIADFDPGPDTHYLLSAGDFDAFISKLDANGNYVWAKRLGGPVHGDIGYSVAVDGAGNVYTTGYYGGTADFNPGPGTYNLTATGLYDIFVLKLDASGGFVWAKSMGGPNVDYGYSIALDASGNVYTTGIFLDETADFDPGAGAHNLTPAGGYDVFISKLDTNGDFVWAKRLGGTNNDYGNSIAVDALGNVFTGGYYSGAGDFDPSPATVTLTSQGGNDVFISKLDTDGNYLWAKSMGGAYYDYGSSIAVDDLGDVYSTGYFQGNADFDPGLGTYNLSAEAGDIFISKLDADGNFSWAKRLGGAEYDYGYSVDVDAFGDVFATGYFQGVADFDPGPDTLNLVSLGDSDIFISKLNANGDLIWAISMGGANDDVGLSIAVDGSQNIYTSGSFSGTVDFDSGAGVHNLTSVGNTNRFISKLSDPAANTSEHINILTPLLYPNPTSGSFTLELQAPAQISLFNTLGEKVYQAQVLENVSQHDLSGLVSGVYYLQVDNRLGVVGEQLIISR